MCVLYNESVHRMKLQILIYRALISSYTTPEVDRCGRWLKAEFVVPVKKEPSAIVPFIVLVLAPSIAVNLDVN